MIISYNKDIETGEQEYSGDILVMGTDKDGNPVVDFTIPLLDVRDGYFSEITYENKNSKKEYTKLIPAGIRRQAMNLEKAGNRTKGSKFIPNKQKFHF